MKHNEILTEALDYFGKQAQFAKQTDHIDNESPRAMAAKYAQTILDQAKTDISEAENRVAELSQENTSLKARIEALEQQVKIKDGQLLSKDSTIKSLQDAVEKIDKGETDKELKQAANISGAAATTFRAPGRAPRY